MQAPATPLLPRDIIVEKTADGVRYRLPRRQLGAARFAGLVPVAFGLIFLAVPVAAAWNIFRDGLHHPTFVHGIFALFLLIFVIAGLKPVTIGMLLLFGRCTVDLGREWVRVIDSAGPFRKMRRAKRDDIRGFEVTSGSGTNMPRLLQPLRDLGGLEARFEEAKPMPVALGYPREWLVALGDELSQHINESHAVHAQPPLPPTASVVKTLQPRQQAVPVEDVFEQPRDSRARVEQAATGLNIVLPPLGMRQGSRSLLVFSLVWCGFMLFFTWAVFFAGTKSRPPVMFAVFIALFWSIGIAMLFAALNMARRRALFIAGASDLRVAQQSLFGKKAWSWSRDAISAIRVGPSGMEVNNRPVLELQVHTIDGTKTGLLRGRDEREMQWIATLLRKQLQIASSGE